MPDESTTPDTSTSGSSTVAEDVIARLTVDAGPMYVNLSEAEKRWTSYSSFLEKITAKITRTLSQMTEVAADKLMAFNTTLNESASAVDTFSQAVKKAPDDLGALAKAEVSAGRAAQKMSDQLLSATGKISGLGREAREAASDAERLCAALQCVADASAGIAKIGSNSISEMSRGVAEKVTAATRTATGTPARTSERTSEVIAEHISEDVQKTSGRGSKKGSGGSRAVSGTGSGTGSGGGSASVRDARTGISVSQEDASDDTVLVPVKPNQKVVTTRPPRPTPAPTDPYKNHTARVDPSTGQWRLYDEKGKPVSPPKQDEIKALEVAKTQNRTQARQAEEKLRKEREALQAYEAHIKSAMETAAPPAPSVPASSPPVTPIDYQVELQKRQREAGNKPITVDSNTADHFKTKDYSGRIAELLQEYESQMTGYHVVSRHMEGTHSVLSPSSAMSPEGFVKSRHGTLEAAQEAAEKLNTETAIKRYEKIKEIDAKINQLKTLQGVSSQPDNRTPLPVKPVAEEPPIPVLDTSNVQDTPQIKALRAKLATLKAESVEAQELDKRISTLRIQHVIAAQNEAQAEAARAEKIDKAKKAKEEVTPKKNEEEEKQEFEKTNSQKLSQKEIEKSLNNASARRANERRLRMREELLPGPGIAPDGYDHARHVAQQITDFQSQYGTSDTEHARVINPDSTVHNFDGSASEVALEHGAIHPGATIIHNHPQGSSFSPDDVASFLTTEAKQSILVSRKKNNLTSLHHLSRAENTPVLSDDEAQDFAESLRAQMKAMGREKALVNLATKNAIQYTNTPAPGKMSGLGRGLASISKNEPAPSWIKGAGDTGTVGASQSSLETIASPIASSVASSLAETVDQAKEAASNIKASGQSAIFDMREALNTRQRERTNKATNVRRAVIEYAQQDKKERIAAARAKKTETGSPDKGAIEVAKIMGDDEVEIARESGDRIRDEARKQNYSDSVDIQKKSAQIRRAAQEQASQRVKAAVEAENEEKKRKQAEASSEAEAEKERLRQVKEADDAQRVQKAKDHQAALEEESQYLSQRATLIDQAASQANDSLTSPKPGTAWSQAQEVGAAAAKRLRGPDLGKIKQSNELELASAKAQGDQLVQTAQEAARQRSRAAQDMATEVRGVDDALAKTLIRNAQDIGREAISAAKKEREGVVAQTRQEAQERLQIAAQERQAASKTSRLQSAFAGAKAAWQSQRNELNSQPEELTPLLALPVPEELQAPVAQGAFGRFTGYLKDQQSVIKNHTDRTNGFLKQATSGIGGFMGGWNGGGGDEEKPHHAGHGDPWAGMMVGGALMGAGGEVIKHLSETFQNSSDFDKEMRKLYATAGVTETGPNADPYNQLSQNIISKSVRWGTDPTIGAQAMYPIASHGFQGAQGQEVLNQSLKMNYGINGDAVETSRLLVKTLDAYNLSADKAAGVTDVLTKAIGLANVDGKDFVTNFVGLLDTSRSLGIPLNDVAAAFAQLTKTSKSPATASTYLRNMLAILNHPTSPMRKAAAAAGLKYIADDQVPQQIDKWVHAGLNPLVELQSDIRRVTHGNPTEIGLLFPDMRRNQAALGLGRLGAHGFEATMDKMKDPGGATDHAVSERDKSWNSVQMKVEATSKAAGIAAFKVLTPLASLLAKMATSALKLFSALSPKDQRLIVYGVALGGALALVLGAVVSLTSALPLMAEALTTVGGALSLANPAKLGLIAAIIALGMAWKDDTGHIRENAKFIGKELVAAITTLVGVVSSLIKLYEKLSPTQKHVFDDVAMGVLVFIRLKTATGLLATALGALSKLFPLLLARMTTLSGLPALIAAGFANIMPVLVTFSGWLTALPFIADTTAAAFGVAGALAVALVATGLLVARTTKMFLSMRDAQNQAADAARNLAAAQSNFASKSEKDALIVQQTKIQGERGDLTDALKDAKKSLDPVFTLTQDLGGQGYDTGAPEYSSVEGAQKRLNALNADYAKNAARIAQINETSADGSSGYSTTDSMAPIGSASKGIDQYDAVIARVAREQGINPNVIKSLMLNEDPSGNRNSTYHNTDGTTDYGLMQVNSGTKSPSTYNWKDAYQNITNGTKIFKDKLAAAGGDLHGAFLRYNGEGPLAEKYAERALAHFNALSGNVPGDHLKTASEIASVANNAHQTGLDKNLDKLGSCAQFMSRVLTQAGVDFKGTLSAKQFRENVMQSGGVQVSASQARPGDVVSFRGPQFGSPSARQNGIGYHAGVVGSMDPKTGQPLITSSSDGNVKYNERYSPRMMADATFYRMPVLETSPNPNTIVPNQAVAGPLDPWAKKLLDKQSAGSKVAYHPRLTHERSLEELAPDLAPELTPDMANVTALNNAPLTLNNYTSKLGALDVLKTKLLSKLDGPLSQSAQSLTGMGYEADKARVEIAVLKKAMALHSAAISLATKGMQTSKDAVVQSMSHTNGLWKTYDRSQKVVDTERKRNIKPSDSQVNTANEALNNAKTGEKSIQSAYKQWKAYRTLLLAAQTGRMDDVQKILGAKYLLQEKADKAESTADKKLLALYKGGVLSRAKYEAALTLELAKVDPESDRAGDIQKQLNSAHQDEFLEQQKRFRASQLSVSMSPTDKASAKSAFDTYLSGVVDPTKNTADTDPNLFSLAQAAQGKEQDGDKFTKHLDQALSHASNKNPDDADFQDQRDEASNQASDDRALAQSTILDATELAKRLTEIDQIESLTRQSIDKAEFKQKSELRRQDAAYAYETGNEAFAQYRAMMAQELALTASTYGAESKEAGDLRKEIYDVDSARLDETLSTWKDAFDSGQVSVREFRQELMRLQQEGANHPKFLPDLDKELDGLQKQAGQKAQSLADAITTPLMTIAKSAKNARQALREQLQGILTDFEKTSLNKVLMMVTKKIYGVDKPKKKSPGDMASDIGKDAFSDPDTAAKLQSDAAATMASAVGQHTIAISDFKGYVDQFTSSINDILLSEGITPETTTSTGGTSDIVTPSKDGSKNGSAIGNIFSLKPHSAVPSAGQMGTTGPGTSGPGTSGPGTSGPGTSGPGTSASSTLAALSPVMSLLKLPSWTSTAANAISGLFGKKPSSDNTANSDKSNPTTQGPVTLFQGAVTTFAGAVTKMVGAGSGDPSGGAGLAAITGGASGLAAIAGAAGKSSSSIANLVASVANSQGGTSGGGGAQTDAATAGKVASVVSGFGGAIGAIGAAVSTAMPFIGAALAVGGAVGLFGGAQDAHPFITKNGGGEYSAISGTDASPAINSGYSGESSMRQLMYANGGNAKEGPSTGAGTPAMNTHNWAQGAVQVNVNGITDPDAIAATVGDQVIQRINNQASIDNVSTGSSNQW